MTDIIATVAKNPVAVLVDEKAYSEFYNRVKEEIAGFKPDISTVKGRGEIAKLAYKVTRSKTAIDAAGKKLNEEARAKINSVDAQRRKIRDELDALAEEVRRPLTEWEEAEKQRVDAIDQCFAIMTDLSAVSPSDTSEEIRRRFNELSEVEIDSDVFRERTREAVDYRQATLDSLSTGLDRALKWEADQAELARLRAEQEAREIADRERAEQERIAKEAAEREARERAEHEANVKRQAEAAERAQKEAAERERIAVGNARLEAEKAAQAERERVEREAAERVAKAEAEANRIKEQLAREDRERAEHIERTKREEEARQADRARQSKVMAETKTAIMDLGADEDTAKKIVLAIRANDVPNVKWVF